MTHTFNTLLLLACALLLWGCSENRPIAGGFVLEKGSGITFHHELGTSHRDKELIFTLSGVPESKTGRDYSDYLGVTLNDINGRTYTPETIEDVNGLRRDIIATCNNIPKGTQITSVRVVALEDLNVTALRWWNGTLH